MIMKMSTNNAKPTSSGDRNRAMPKTKPVSIIIPISLNGTRLAFVRILD
jgi:hypothetical protein